MNDEYQLRKDIDKALRFIDGLETDETFTQIMSRYYDQSEVDITTSNLKNEINTINEEITPITEEITTINEEITSINTNKQNKIPSMSLEQTITNTGGGTIKVYTDGLYVLITFSGDFTKTTTNATIATNGTSKVAQISNSEYYPSTYITSACSTVAGNYSRIAINGVGEIYVINATSVASVTCRTEVMYPVASRISGGS